MRLYGPGPIEPPPLVPTQDLAGLRTTDVEDRPVGALFGALSEDRSGLIRYLDVELDGAAKHILVPIGHVRIDMESVQPRVRLRAATYEDLLSIPDYDPDDTALDGRYQSRLLGAYGRLFDGAHYYAHPAYDHTALYAGDNPIIGSSDVAARDGREAEDHPAPALIPLSRVTGKASAGDPDLRGRAVEDGSGEPVGPVVDLLVEASTGRVRYAIIELGGPGRHAILPVGYLRPKDEGAASVLVAPDLTAEDIRLLPPYEEPVTRADENRIHAALEGSLVGERYFQRPDFRPR